MSRGLSILIAVIAMVAQMSHSQCEGYPPQWLGGGLFLDECQWEREGPLPQGFASTQVDNMITIPKQTLD